MPIEIVELNHSLIREASLLLAGYRAEGGWDGGHAEECEAALLRLLEDAHTICLLARHQDEYAGFVTYHWGFSTTKGLPILKIQDVYTSPKHRNSGVGQALLQHTVELARERGAHRLQLETDTGNLPARSLYEKLGFEWISQKEVYMLPLSRWRMRTFGQKSDGLDYARRKGCYAVIFDEDKQQVAAVLTAAGHYFLPGGGLEDGETDHECLRREVLEETGYAIHIGSLIGEAERYFLSSRNEPLIGDGKFYTAQFAEKVQDPAEDDHSLQWIRVEEADNLLFHEHHSWAVRCARAANSDV
ncbi:bifunctional GNAT family N-acetyltransferase/NUDIX hydrolase [Paenibacillus hamazuiensis]|uniref:bifunctional GNAT family N-acetyltransferase/NUDIX hydrolase n=1 Tax=Paenibacillus hamazuiensis TaxID=2936508 RepID=UPI00200CB551|nr:bifunctional GNAT family N-acetyltransferase/NUDIX hydrolase [Paenibacillus hamazuiensis]